ncbi:MAG: CsgG/HfaB family protein [Sediminispirochaetaceae bacterium]
MKKIILPCACIGIFVCILFSASADERIAVIDFEVESANEEYQYLGKGFAEFVSVELSQVDQVILIDRKRRNAVLEEMRFGISGLADESTTKEMGKLLSADYLITGMIIDMAGMLVVTCELIEVETGELIVHQKADGSVIDYNKITKSLAGAVIAGLNLTGTEAVRIVQEKQESKAAPPVKKPSVEEAKTVITSFSEAIDAYDDGDTGKAKRQLEVAAAIDTENRAVKFYIDKLNLIIPKYQPEYPLVGLISNPAVAGTFDKPMGYIRFSMFEPWLLGNGDLKHQLENGEAGDIKSGSGRIGWIQPVKSNFGINIELSCSSQGEQIKYGREISGEGYSGEQYSGDGFYYGATIGFGWNFSYSWAVGFQGTLNYQFPNPYGDADINHNHFDQDLPANFGGSLGLGLIGRFHGGRFIVDINTNFVMMERYYLDLESDSIVKGTMPSNVTLTFVSEVIEQKLFLSLKNSADIFRDSTASGIYLKETPVAEYWFSDSLGFRAGYHFTWLKIDAESAVGHGFLTGLSIRLKNWDIDVNYTLSRKPLTGLEGETIPHGEFLYGASYKM